MHVHVAGAMLPVALRGVTAVSLAPSSPGYRSAAMAGHVREKWTMLQMFSARVIAVQKIWGHRPVFCSLWSECSALYVPAVTSEEPVLSLIAIVLLDSALRVLMWAGEWLARE